MKRRKDKETRETRRAVRQTGSFRKLVRFKKLVSTGSTVLDLMLSGRRVRGGGLPGGILVEIYGPEGGGKTALISSISASAQHKGGSCRFRDPEGRLDKEYAETYNLSIRDEFFDYDQPNTVAQLFKDYRNWKPENKNAINVFCADSVAALSTDMEMEDEDKRGQRQAKEFSQNLRKSARIIAQDHLLTLFTNQIREGERGETTPGGRGIRFYASVRLRVSKTEDIERKRKVGKKEIKKTIGIVSTCYVKKSTIDDPYRMCDIYIKFRYGIDDVHGNLQYLKDIYKDTMYDCFGKRFHGVDAAIAYIEKHKLQRELREKVIDTWEKVEREFEIKREPKEWY